MPGYRLYFLEPDKGRLQREAKLHSSDDVGAICLAQEHMGPSALELWCGDRLVARMGAANARMGATRNEAPFLPRR